MQRLWMLAALGVGVLMAPSVARAEGPLPPVQANGGLLIGVAGQGSGSFWQETLFHGGLKADVLWGRGGPFTWGYGPMVGVSTNHFRDLNLSAGGSLLIPVQEYLPLVLQAGPYVRFHDGANPGAFASLFWGSKSYNYHGSYSPTLGLSVEGRLGFGDEKERNLIVAAHVDLELIAMPALFLVNLFR